MAYTICYDSEAISSVIWKLKACIIDFMIGPMGFNVIQNFQILCIHGPLEKDNPCLSTLAWNT